jgi:hypothetical protein
VLGVDLGLRYAAACAVWECLSTEQLIEKCEEFAHEQRPGPHDLFFHLPDPNHPNRKIIYRRIQPDDTDAPWARLERSFLVRLDGEQCSARRPTEEELKIDRKLAEDGFGYQAATATDGADHQSTKTVAQLRRQMLRGMKAALRRHSDKARIALYLRESDPKKQLASILRALEIWHNLTATDSEARDRWNRLRQDSNHLVPLPLALNGKPAESPRKKSPKQQEEYAESLRPGAEKIQSLGMGGKLAQAWETHWSSEDSALREAIRKVRNVVLPRRGFIHQLNSQKPGLGTHTLRGVGGMSIDRIEDLRAFYKLQKAYWQRLHPQPDHQRPTINKGFSRRALLAMEHLRE